MKTRSRGLRAALKRVWFGAPSAALRVLIALAVLTLGSPLALADGRVALDAGWGWPYVAPYDRWLIDPFYPGYWYSPCYPYVSCAVYREQLLERRRERLRQADAEAQRAAQQAWQEWKANQRGSSAGRAAEMETQPEYAASGEVRPEYEQTGKFLPEFLNGTVRPGRP